MRIMLAPLVLCAVFLGGCAETTERAVQQEVNYALQEATIVMATRIALESGLAAEPAVATEAVRRYQDILGTIAALEPTARAQKLELVPASAPPTDPTEAAHMAQAQTAAAAAAIPVMASGPSAGSGTPTLTSVTATMVSEPSVEAMPSSASYEEMVDLDAFPVMPATSALAGIVLPTTQAAMEALFLQMPPTLIGLERVKTIDPGLPAGTLTASYGVETWIDGTPVNRLKLLAMEKTDRGGENSAQAGENSAHVVAGFYLSYTLLSVSDAITTRGRDGHVYWVHNTWPVADAPLREVHTLMLGTDTGSWLITLVALSSAELEVLADAFASAAAAAHLPGEHQQP
jgi:hypothetical protein